MNNNIGRMGYGALRSKLMRQQPIMDRLAEKYGVTDPETLLELIFEGAQHGSVHAESMPDECDICREYADMLLQAIMLRDSIPGFDLDSELSDPRFSHLVLQPPHGAGLSLEAAYGTLHRAEAEEAARMKQLQLAGYAARNTARKLANAIMSGGMRPMENGTGAYAAVITATDPRKLSREERADIRRRVNSGEKIHW